MKLRIKVDLDAKKLILLTGTTLLLLPDGITWVWGNLVAYVDSYLRFTFGLANCGGTTWVIPVFVALFPVGIAISDVLVKRTGPSWTMMTGIFLYNVPFVMSYVTVQHSVEALVVTTGALPGLGHGVLYGLALFIVSSFQSKYSGILLAIVTSGVTGGSLLTNEIMTYYINPSNASPNLTVKAGRSESYFTQQDVIDRVPSSFLVFAGTCLTIHLIGFLLIISVFGKVILKKSSNIKTDGERLTKETLSTASEQYKEKSRLLGNAQCKLQRCRSRSRSSNSLHELDSEVNSPSRNDKDYRKRSLSFTEPCRYPESSVDVKKLASTHGQIGNAAVVTKNCTNSEGVSEEQDSKICGQLSKPNQTDLTTLQMIKTSAFYVLFLCYTSGDLSFVIVQNYYKLYGQIYIKDDHFITNSSMVTVITTVILRLGFGAMVDFLGVKNTLILFQSSLTIIAQIWYFAPMVDKWFYMILTTGFRCLVSGLYIIFGAATLAVFGKTYFARNVSMLMFLSIAFNLFGPLIMEVILHDFGWYALCLVCSLINFCGLCASLIIFPRI